MSDYDERRERRREEERKYQGDVWYDVWRSGGAPDRVDRDRVSQNFQDGVDEESAVRRELAAQRPKPQLEEQYDQQ